MSFISCLSSVRLKRAHFLAAAMVAGSVFLAGCQDSTTSASKGTAAVAATPVSVETIAAQAKGFSVGSPMSARTVYVFFDTQCPHCGALWEAAKPLKSQARFVWIPVGLLNASSTAQGATLLASADPVAAMNQHEVSMQARTGGITAAGQIDAQKADVTANTALLSSMGFASIPTVVGKHAKTGAVVTQEGSSSTSVLAQLLGLQMPAAGAEGAASSAN